MATNLKQVADQLMADIMTKIQNGEYEMTYGANSICWLTVDGIKDVQIAYDGDLTVPLKIEKNGRAKDIFNYLQDEMLRDRLKRATEEKERIEQEIERRKQQAEQGDH